MSGESDESVGSRPRPRKGVRYVTALPGRRESSRLMGGSQFFFDTAGPRDKTLKLYEGHFHDLLNDFGKEEVMADIKGWIEERLPAA